MKLAFNTGRFVGSYLINPPKFSLLSKPTKEFKLPDRQLACAPAKSNEIEDYIGAISSAANFAWSNRQMITHWTRESFEKTFGKSADQLDMGLIYDVAHNIAKIEEHVVDGGVKKVYVHRKGATRAFPPGHPAIPPEYREIGQPVLIPGSMGTASWVLIGTPKAMELSFGTTAHWAGRFMSRAAGSEGTVRGLWRICFPRREL